jgi:cell division protein FtsQ
MKRPNLRHGAVVGAPPEFPPLDRSRRRGAKEAQAAWTSSVADDQASPSRLGAQVWALCKLATGVALVVGAALGVAWAAHRYALTSPRFMIREVSIEGRQRTTEAELRKRAGIEVGSNIFALDTRLAEKRLLDDPWIREAKVWRELPGKLRIQLSERDAAAVAVVGGHLYLVTRTGEPFKEVESGDPYDLPLITGISAQSLGRDRAGEASRIRTALEVISTYGKLAPSRVHPAEEVHLTEGGQVVLTVGKSGITLHLGKGPWTKKLLMAERVLGKTAAQGRTPGIVFLDNEANPERVVVRMR